jgi:hypothetical protein
MVVFIMFAIVIPIIVVDTLAPTVYMVAGDVPTAACS